MNILLPKNSQIDDNDVIHTWYSPITNKNTMHFSDNLPLDIPEDFGSKEVYIIMDKFESINLDFIHKIENKKVCLDVGAEEFIEYYTNQYLISFFREAHLMQLNHNICDYVFKKFKIKNDVDFFDLLNLDLLVITNGKKGAKFLYRENGKLVTIDKKPPVIANAVDTSGAGDAFFSTIIREYAYSEKIDKAFIDNTFEKANKSSRDILSKVGSRA